MYRAVYHRLVTCEFLSGAGISLICAESTPGWETAILHTTRSFRVDVTMRLARETAEAIFF